MNIGSKKLFQNLGLSRDSAKGATEGAVLPLVPGQKFEPSAIAMSARDLIERLCFERFRGAVYFQGEDERGDLLGVALVEGDRLTGALFSAGQTQWIGAAAWTLLCALNTLPQCLMLEVEAPFLEAYSALLKQNTASTSSVEARRLPDLATDFATKRETGALRVSVEGQTLVQFFHRGASLGVYSVDSSGRLSKRSDDFEGAPPLPRKARVELWTREEQTLYRSPSPFDARRTLALARFLDTALSLGTHLMPPDMARAGWCEVVEQQGAICPWMSELKSARTLDLPPSRRLMAFKAVLKSARETPSAVVQGVSAVADQYLAPIAHSIGADLFAREAVRAFSPSERELLLELGVTSRSFRLDAPETSAASSSVLDAISGVRHSHAPHRTRSKTSAFDF